MNKNRLETKEYIGAAHIKAGIRNSGSFPLHAHEYFEIEIITDGSGTETVNGKDHKIKSGTVFALSPSDFHEIKANGSLRIVNISFDPAFLSDGLSKLLPRFPYIGTLSENDIEKTEAIVKVLEKEDDPQRKKCLADYIFKTIFGFNGIKTAETPIEKAKRFTDLNFRDDPKLKEVAAVACLHPAYFGNAFKKATGMTYIEYLNSRKLRCAEMLLSSGKSVTEACFESGFGSLSGFLYTFRKHSGITPSEYKERKSKENKSGNL